MSKLRSVIRHEYSTIVKQPSFWIVMVAIPLAIAIVMALVFFSNNATSSRIEEMAKDMKNVVLVDESGLINKDVVKASGLTLADSKNAESLRQEVQEGKKEGLVVYPKNLQKERNYKIYLASNDITKISSITSLADSLLKTSVFLPLGNAEVISLAQNGAASTVTTYKNGKETAGFNEYIAPGMFIILFYIIFAFSISYMLSSVSEEKENRSMEMVLTYVKPRTLILGKLLAVSLVVLTQIAFYAVLALAAVLIIQKAGVAITMPLGIDLAKLVFDPMAMFFGFAFLVVGFLMYAGFMTATAAMAPSAKEANNFSSVFFIGAFIPFYFITLVVTAPQSAVVTFMTYFPLTSPIISLVRNTFGSMTTLESFVVLAVMIIFMVLSIWAAVRAFRLGALEFSQAISLKKLFDRK